MDNIHSCDAANNGVVPSVPFSTSAPFDSKQATTSLCPLAAANHNGHLPTYKNQEKITVILKSEKTVKKCRFKPNLSDLKSLWSKNTKFSIQNDSLTEVSVLNDVDSSTVNCTIKSCYKSTRFDKKSRYKEQGCAYQIHFRIKKSQYSEKSRYEPLKCADRAHSLYRDCYCTVL